MMSLLERTDILRALRALDGELGRMGIRGEIFVVGGAAMALAYDVRRSTVDVDAVFAPSAEVRNASRKVATAWISNRAGSTMPPRRSFPATIPNASASTKAHT